MSDRDIVERLEDTLQRGLLGARNPVSFRDCHAEILRLRSELADAKRLGWITGRDAAAEIGLEIRR